MQSQLAQYQETVLRQADVIQHLMDLTSVQKEVIATTSNVDSQCAESRADGMSDTHDASYQQTTQTHGGTMGGLGPAPGLMESTYQSN
jgi:hypothetical protein